MKSALCNCITLYDFTAEKTDVKSWFYFMDSWANEVGIPWESLGSKLSRKLVLYKNGKRKIEKNSFDTDLSIETYGGVSEPGTHLDWKTCNSLSVPKNGLSGESYLCFPNDAMLFTTDNMRAILKQLLECADFKYGICYQRPYNMGPELYAGGALGGKTISDAEEDKIGYWAREYGRLKDGNYRTGLLRDVYPHNILIDQHLSEKVSDATLGEWIKSSPNHGTLEKITEHHWLWSIDPQHIPVAQEVLQEASLLLCYKV
jgi:hypothetical protein